VAKQGLIERHDFLLRRLHSLSGIVPIGVFLIVHLITNSSLAWGKFMTRGGAEGLSIQEGGAAYFQHEVSYINEQVPHLLLIEISLWLAIGFHSVFGVMIAMSGKRNTSRYAYQDNFRYALQRVTGYLGVLFIFYHVATLRWGWDFLVPGGTRWDHQFSASTLAAALRGGTEGVTPAGVAVSVGYFFGVTALVFHFANGLWTAAITWGLTVSEGAQKRWGLVCFVLGAGLMLAAWSSLGAAVMLDPAQARAVEEHIILEEDDIGRVRLERLEAEGQESPAAEPVEADGANAAPGGP